MQEIPHAYVRANQWGIVIYIVAALILQNPWVIGVLWLIETAGLVGGSSFNLFIQIAKPLVQHKIADGLWESVELQRFNNSIAVLLLTGALLAFYLDSPLVGWGLAVAVAVAAGVALGGYCIGCTLYYWLGFLRKSKSKEI